MSTSIKAGLLGGVILFIWGMVSWMVMPYHHAVINAFPNESAVIEMLKTQAPRAGIYTVPSNFETLKKGEAFAFLSVRPNGVNSGVGQMFAVSLVGNIGLGILVAMIVSSAKGTTYSRRFGLIVLMGAFAAVAAYLPLWNWWGFSTDYVVAMMLDTLIGWTAAGGVMARFLNGN